MKHIVQLSSGMGSWLAAKRVIELHGRDDVIALFADVQRDGGEWWEGEDPDNYRFLKESSEAIGLEVVTVKDGRGVWGLAEEQNMIPNNRVPFCSRILKHDPCRKWINENADPEQTTIHFGIDFTEEQRCDPIRKRWAPWKVDFPLIWKPLALKHDGFDELNALGIKPPRMYEEGFQHANCAGACVRMGNGAAEHLYRTRPDVYAGMMAKEELIRSSTGKNVSILVNRRGLKKGEPRKPFPLAELEERIHQEDHHAKGSQADPLFDDMSCGRCFES